MLCVHCYRDGNAVRLELKSKSSDLEAWPVASVRGGPRDHTDLGSKPTVPPPTLMLGGRGRFTFPSRASASPTANRTNLAGCCEDGRECEGGASNGAWPAADSN